MSTSYCRGSKRPHSPQEDGLSEELAQDNEEWNISNICLVILAEVFSLIDSPERPRLRRTCPSWNSAIMSPICQRVIKFDPYYPLQHHDPVFWKKQIGTALVQQKCNMTQYLIFSPSSRLCLGAHGIDFVLHMVSLTGKKKPTVVLANVEIDAGYLVNTCDLALSGPVSLVCDRMVLKNVTLTNVFGDEYREVCPEFNLHGKPHARIPLCSLNTNNPGALSSILERIHMDMHENALKCLAQWIRHVFKEEFRMEHLRHRYHIPQILFLYQRGDARFNSWKGTEATKLYLNFKKLRKPTLSVLVEYMKTFVEQDYCFFEYEGLHDHD